MVEQQHTYYLLLVNEILLLLIELSPTRHKIGHFADVLASRSLGLVLKNENKHNKSKHAFVTKCTTT